MSTLKLLLVIIDLFSLGVTAEALRVNIDWKSAFLKESFGPIFQIEGDVPHQQFFMLGKLESSIFRMV